MKCSLVKIGGNPVFLCGSERTRACADCGQISTRLCDWKTGTDRTCDASICDDCTTQPAKHKDLCKRHAAMWKTHQANRQQELSL